MPPKNNTASDARAKSSTRLESKSVTKSGENNGVQKQVEVLERENMMLRKKLDIAEIIKELSRRGCQENDMHEMFRESLHDLELKLKKYESGCSMNENISDIQLDLERERRKSLSALQEVNQNRLKIYDLEKQLKAKTTELDLMKNHSSFSVEQRKELEVLKRLHEDLVQEHEKLKEQNASLNQQKDELEQKQRDLEDKLKRLTKELSDVKQHRDELKQQNDTLHEERSLQSVQEEMSEIEALRTEMRQQTAKMEEQTSEIVQLKENLEQTTKEKTIAQRRFHENEANLKTAEKTIQEKNSTIEKLNIEKQKMEEEKNNVEKEVDRLSMAKIEAERLSEEMREKLSTQQTNLSSVVDVSSLKEDLSRLTKELEELKRTKDRLIEEKDRLHNSCHEAFENMKQKDKKMKLMEEEHKKLIERKDETIQKLRKEKTMVDPTAGSSTKIDTKSLKDKYDKTAQELKEARDEINELKTRLSQFITEENPNLQDFSNENRPTRLSQKFSEIYENEWTDAFSEVEHLHKKQTDVVGHLYQMLLDINEFCQTIAVEYAKSVRSCILTVPYAVNGKLKTVQVSDSDVRWLNEVKRRFAVYLKDNVFDHYINTMKVDLKGKPHTQKFVRECVNVCWLMSSQEPPVVLDTANVMGDFDGERFKTYTKAGRTIDYVVWPPVLLLKDGALLCKGVAQGK